jgi:hypothetical protein
MCSTPEPLGPARTGSGRDGPFPSSAEWRHRDRCQHLVVIANGIPSASVSATVGTTSTFTLSVSELGGTVTRSPAGINCPGTCSATFGQGRP